MGKHSSDEDDIKVNYDSNGSKHLSKSMNDAATTSLIEHHDISDKYRDDWGAIKLEGGEIFLANTYWKAPALYLIDELLLSEEF